jgi:hypothetical protein
VLRLGRRLEGIEVLPDMITILLGSVALRTTKQRSRALGGRGRLLPLLGHHDYKLVLILTMVCGNRLLGGWLNVVAEK